MEKNSLGQLEFLVLKYPKNNEVPQRIVLDDSYLSEKIFEETKNRLDLFEKCLDERDKNNVISMFSSGKIKNSLNEFLRKGWIKYDKRIFYLDLNNEGLEKIPDEVFELDGLKNLYLYDNEISTIPKNISKLKNLNLLNISNNEIKFIPSEIGTLQNLKYLNLDENPLHFIAKAYLNSLSNRKNLKISYSREI